MAIFPGKKKEPSMIQVAGDGEVRSLMEGKERIYSREDTEKIIRMANSAKSQKDLAELGKFVYQATKKQDSRKPEFVKE